LALPEAQDVLDGFVVGDRLFDDLDLGGGHGQVRGRFSVSIPLQNPSHFSVDVSTIKRV
jgi:hypothetical protein